MHIYFSLERGIQPWALDPTARDALATRRASGYWRADVPLLAFGHARGPVAVPLWRYRTIPLNLLESGIPAALACAAAGTREQGRHGLMYKMDVQRISFQRIEPQPGSATLLLRP